MSIYSELREQIDEFILIRTKLLDGPVPSPPELDADNLDIDFGPPPYVIEDELTSFGYAVVLESSEVHPLPFGYFVSDEHLDSSRDPALCSRFSGSGLANARLVPIASDFSLPEPAAFEIENIADSEVWSVAEQMLETQLDSVVENVRREFGPLLLTSAISVKKYDDIESIDEVLGAALGEPGYFLRIFSLSLQLVASSVLKKAAAGLAEYAE